MIRICCDDDVVNIALFHLSDVGLGLSKALQQSLYWLLVSAVLFGVQYLYHPNLNLMIIGWVLSLLLTALTAWSGSRISKPAIPIKLLLVSTIASLMNSQALDVAYSITSAPLGNRFDFVVEVLGFACLFLVISLIGRRFSGPKH